MQCDNQLYYSDNIVKKPQGMLYEFVSYATSQYPYNHILIMVLESLSRPLL